MAYSVVRWSVPQPPSESDVRQRFSDEGLEPSRWSNGPGDRYSVHSHSYHKVLYCLNGSITFEVEGEKIVLHPGDRLDLEPGTAHAALVGPEGVACMEAPR